VSPRIRGFALLACLGAIVGCTASASVSPTTPPPGCGQDSSVSCSEGTGWSCQAGDNPENEQSNVSCSIPTPDGPNDDFCCFEWTYGSTCTPDDGLTSVCQGGSYGYRCQAGDDPTSLDSSLNCSSPTPDGSDDDFCCH
jgi:hypothetical protein